MIKYLSTLQEKPDHHKKQFAFLASATISLFIFGVWSVTNFSPKADQTLARGSDIDSNTIEVSPLESIRNNLASSLEAIYSSFGGLKSGLETIDLEAKYLEMRDGALDVYGK